MRGQLPGSPRTSDKKVVKNASAQDSNELEFLVDSRHTCPVCDCTFFAKEVKPGKAQTDGTDLDLRPRYKKIDALKYRMIECPGCGFADFERFFSDVDSETRQVLMERMIIRDVHNPKEVSPRSYAEAFRYSKSALRCNLIRGAKSSKRAYTALCTAWILRGWRESLKKDGIKVSPDDTMGMEEESKLKKYALRNFRDAENNERFPIMGMPESTFEYLMGVLCYEQDELKDAEKYMLRALKDQELKPQIHSNAEDVMDMIERKKNAFKAAEQG